MRALVWILLFIIQVITGAMTICTWILWVTSFPTKTDMFYPCFASFIICSLAFIINQFLQHTWDNYKDN